MAQQPVQFAPAGGIPFIHLPDPGALFLDRSRRLEQLAQGHSLGPFMRFMAVVAMGQHQALATESGLELPAPQPGAIPLPTTAMPLHESWHRALRTIIGKSLSMAPPQLQGRMQHLADAPAEMDRLAQCYLAGRTAPESLMLMPLVACALQVYWTALTQHLESAGGLPARHGGSAENCPTCGSPPVGSLVHAGGALQGLRTLVCSLCPTQWHFERIHCISCGDSAAVFYYSVQNQPGGVRAETCDACGAYSKILYLESQPEMEIFADDLSTMALDVLVSNAGYRRYGMNPFVLQQTE